VSEESGQRLSEGDFARLKGVVKQAIKEDVPPIVREELSNIGLAVHDGDAKIAAQADMRFLRLLRLSTGRLGMTIMIAVALGVVAGAGALMSAGFWTGLAAGIDSGD